MTSPHTTRAILVYDFPQHTSALGVRDDNRLIALRMEQNSAQGTKKQDNKSQLLPKRRSIDHYKANIVGWHKDGKSRTEIRDLLFENHGCTVGPGVVTSTMVEWGLVEAQKAKTGSRGIWNLEPYREMFLEWDKSGISHDEMRSKFKGTHGLEIQKHAIQKSLDRWNGVHPWRKIDDDPHLHTYPTLPHPVDLLTHDDLEKLQANIKSAYKKDLDNDQISTSGWEDIIVQALYWDRTVQAAIIDDRLQHGLHWSPRRKLNPQWVLGIHLPGSYSSSVDSLFKIMAVVDQLTPHILERVKSNLETWLEQSIAGATLEYGIERVRPLLERDPMTAPADCVAELLHLARTEIDSGRREAEVKQLLALQDLDLLPACRRFNDSLPNAIQSSIVKVFTDQACHALEGTMDPAIVMSNLPPLTEADMQCIRDNMLVERNLVPRGKGGKAVYFDGQEDESDKENQHQEEQKTNGKGTTTNRGNMGQRNSISLRQLLSEHVSRAYSKASGTMQRPVVFRDWRAPTTGPFLDSAPARFMAPSWVPGPISDNLHAKVQRSNETILEESLQYLANTINQRSEVEQKNYRKACSRMAKCSTRPESAIQIHGEITYSLIARNDDWWHCRRLWQMVAASLSKDIYLSFERKLMMLLAATECGSTDPLLWLVPLEGLLQTMIETVTISENTIDRRIQKDLLRELVNFSHSVALNNLYLRSSILRINEETKVIAPSRLQKWYTMLFSIKPRCHYDLCSELLPHPRTIDRYRCDDRFSVGANDTRRGSPAARSYISHNRVFAYNCLWEWIRRLEPHPSLGLAFAFYGGIFHTKSSCKAKRGKQLQNF